MWAVRWRRPIAVAHSPRWARWVVGGATSDFRKASIWRRSFGESSKNLCAEAALAAVQGDGLLQGLCSTVVQVGSRVAEAPERWRPPFLLAGAFAELAGRVFCR